MKKTKHKKSILLFRILKSLWLELVYLFWLEPIFYKNFENYVISFWLANAYSFETKVFNELRIRLEQKYNSKAFDENIYFKLKYELRKPVGLLLFFLTAMVTSKLLSSFGDFEDAYKIFSLITIITCFNLIFKWLPILLGRNRIDNYYKDAKETLNFLKNNKNTDIFIDQNKISNILNKGKTELKFENKSELAYLICFLQFCGMNDKKLSDSEIKNFIEKNHTINGKSFKLGKSLSKIRGKYRSNNKTHEKILTLFELFHKGESINE